MYQGLLVIDADAHKLKNPGDAGLSGAGVSRSDRFSGR